MINANILTLDEITSTIALYIQEELNNVEDAEVKLSIGSLTGINFLSGFGPDIKIKVATAGAVTTEVKSEFVSQGINQTIHRVYLQVDCNVNILTTYKTVQESISNQVLLVENVILGQVPSTYLNVE